MCFMKVSLRTTWRKDREGNSKKGNYCNSCERGSSDLDGDQGAEKERAGPGECKVTRLA